VVEAAEGGPGGEGGFAKLREALLEAVEDFAGMGIARGDGAAGARIAAFKTDFADGEANGAALVGAEEMIFPEGGNAVDFERGAETKAEVVDGEAGEAAGIGSEPGGNSLQGSGGDDGGSVGEGVVGEAVFGITDDDLLLKEHAEPFGGFFVGFRKSKGACGNTATIAGDGESDGAEVGGVGGANDMNDGSALTVDPLAIDGVEGPGAIVDESTGGGDAGLEDFDRVEGFDGMEANVGKFRSGLGH